MKAEKPRHLCSSLTRRTDGGWVPRPRRSRRALPGVLALLVTAVACDPGGDPDHPVPSASEIEALYQYAGGLEVEISGNVAQITVRYDPAQFERGGNLWAKAFPFIFLYSPATRDAFQEHPGLGGVRVIGEHPNGDIVAQALLSRGVLNEITWRRAINIAGRARQEGTTRPALMQELVRWGEDHSEFEYNSTYITSR
jgi:hypothetical protein